MTNAEREQYLAETRNAWLAKQAGGSPVPDYPVAIGSCVMPLPPVAEAVCDVGRPSEAVQVDAVQVEAADPDGFGEPSYNEEPHAQAEEPVW